MEIGGNTILVTGGSSGIGRALAEALHDRGNRVIVAGRRQRLLEEVVAGRPGMAALPLDLDDPASLAGFTDAVRTRHPDLNVLVANAGISRAEDVTAENWDAAEAAAMVETNIMGVIRAVAAVLPVLKSKPGATVMATTSNLAYVPLASFPTYCASKAFLHSWLQSLRYQLRRVPVEVLEIAPPYVQTELVSPAQATDPRAMPLDTYVAGVMRILEAGDHPGGEVQVLPERRLAEREGRYDAVFNLMNPP